MIITKNKVASLMYTLKRNNYDGQIIETIGKEEAVEFLFGVEKLLPSFELALEGKQTGDNFRFQISSGEAYGNFNPDAVIELSKDIFKHNGEMNNEILVIGNEIPMMDSHGKRINGIVKEVKESAVVMDFNHPMAGNDLYFEGTVGLVRDASHEELNPSQGCGCGNGGGGGHQNEDGGCSSSKSEGDSCCSTNNSHDEHGNHGGHGGCECGA